MLRALRTKCFGQQLASAVQHFETDCEKGILKAVNAIFCEHIITRMLLSFPAGKTHFTIAIAFKAVWRTICRVSLWAIYRSNSEVRTFCRMMAALALLPENDVHLALENLKVIAAKMPP